jgi:hypothetical protein
MNNSKIGIVNLKHSFFLKQMSSDKKQNICFTTEQNQPEELLSTKHTKSPNIVYGTTCTVLTTIKKKKTQPTQSRDTTFTFITAIQEQKDSTYTYVYDSKFNCC